ncbi:NYN domain-containing protein [Palleronia marisminoris]|uniref:NYN domain-containing protein n=1 Tax=Palleronia marisminoris TaxID=315423 RepID=UPI001C31E556|nr:NYN domain-containing protein [Palleronia marisminoris]
MDPDPSQVDDLHRIFFYDCPPLTKRAHQPISGRSVNLAKTDEAVFRLALHDSLRRQRKVALRLGHLDEKNAEWELRPGVLKSLLRGDRAWAELTDEDFRYYARQKVVDLKIGVDIALLAEKKLVDRIVLMAGDSDFVPASKHARREGLDIVLDPLWNPVMPDLWEHIDGLRSTSPRPRRGEEA